MRLATRMKITYGMVFFIPILLMVITFWGMGRIELRTLRQKYDMQNAGMEVLIDPFQVLGNMSSSVVEELLATAEQNPEQLCDTDYLDRMDKRLSEHDSFLVMRRDSAVYYFGQDEEMNSVAANVEVRQADGDYIVGEDPYYLKQFTFYFEDESEGTIQIFTPVISVVKQVENTILRSCICAVVILLLVGALAFIWL